ncbi:MAG: hypothetical protein NXI24_00585 [bacterium]|nr:hypothetical protein [bacterium]
MSAENRPKRIAFFLYESRELSTYPTITNAAELLARDGYQVDIYLPEHMLCDIQIPGITLIHSSRANSADYIRSTLRRLQKSKAAYDFFFAAYFEGLAIAALAQKLSTKRTKRILRTPIVYLSMELIYGDYAHELETILKDPATKRYRRLLFLLRLVEMTEALWSRLPAMIARPFQKIRDSQGIGRVASARYHRSVLDETLSVAREAVAFSIVQDEHRESVLRREFDFVDRTVRLPNSYIGFEYGASDFAKRRFGVPGGKKIVLYSGAVERGFGSEFFKLPGQLGEDFVLIVNAYSRDGYLNELRGELSGDLESGRLILNDTLLSDADYEQLVQSSRICLAWYGPPDDGDDNMFYLGLSSGKMNRYLACGRPVIVPDYYFGYRELMQETGAGIACSRVAEIAPAIMKIDENYDSYRQHVKTFFESELEFETCFQGVLDEMRRTTQEASQ